MKRLVLGQRATLVAGVVMWAGVAGAEPADAAPTAVGPGVQIVAIDPKACVSETELRSALRQAGVVLASSADAPDTLTSIAVRGTPDHLSVVLRWPGHDGSTALPRATCATATDVVAAFLTSTLAPASGAPVAAPAPPLDPALLNRAVRDDLARRGIQLALLGIRLSLERDSTGTWLARVQGKALPSATRSIVLGNFDDSSAQRIDAVTDPIATAIRELYALEHPPPAPTPPPQTALHHALDAVDTEARASWVISGAEIVEGGLVLSALLSAQAAHAHFSFTTAPNAFLSASATGAVLGGATSFFVDDDYRKTVAIISGYAAIGAFATGTSLAPERDVPVYSTVAIAAGSYSTAALLTLNTILRPPPISRLRAARRKLRDRRATPAEVQEIERDLAATEPVVPAIVTYAPLIVGGLVSTLPVFVKHSRDDRGLVAIAGSSLAIFGLFGAFIPTNYSWYQRELREAGISDLAVGSAPGAPFGISLSGRF